MRKVLIGIAAIVAAAAVVLAALYFKGSLFKGGAFHGAPSAGQSHWVAALFPLDKISPTKFALVKQFGQWRLICRREETAPKVGVIQNFGIVPGETASLKPSPCQVLIRMQDETTPLQTMVLGFRYRSGLPNPDVSIFYITLGRPDVLYRSTGQMIDLNKKDKLKVRGGFYTGQFAPRNPDYQETRAQDVHVQLARHDLTVPTANCKRAHCVAHTMDADISGIGPGVKIVVRLPGPPHGQPRDVAVPSLGLDSALAELRRLSAS